MKPQEIGRVGKLISKVGGYIGFSQAVSLALFGGKGSKQRALRLEGKEKQQNPTLSVRHVGGVRGSSAQVGSVWCRRNPGGNHT